MEGKSRGFNMGKRIQSKRQKTGTYWEDMRDNMDASVVSQMDRFLRDGVGGLKAGRKEQCIGTGVGYADEAISKNR